MALRLCQLLVVCIFAASCCASSCSPYALNLASATPVNLTGTGTDNSEVVTALTDLLEDRRYWPGTTMCRGGCTGDHDGSKIIPGPVDTFVLIDTYQTSDRVEGTGIRKSGRYTMEFDLEAGHLALDSDFNTTQKLLNEIKGEQAEDISASRTTASGTFNGQLAGQPVNLTFDVELRGVI